MSEPAGLRIVLIDDDEDVRRTLAAHLRGQGHATRVAASGEEGMALLEGELADIVITDMLMPGMNGDEVLRRVRQSWPDTEVVVITAFGDVEGAVRAMRDGAFDYFSKPYEVHDISACLQRTARFQALRRENERFRRRLGRAGERGRRQFGVDSLIGDSPAMAVVRERVRQVAAVDTTVLITGETGTGKELVARAVHYESGRAGGPFVALDCTSVPATLAEAELFGHVQGAFTDARRDRVGVIEQADGGTLFLDEVGDMDPAVQARLLRALEERRVRPVGGDAEVEVDVRVVAATHRDLHQAVAEGGFRQDLLYRLDAFDIRVPALRERPQDIPVLARHFLARYRRDLRRPVEGFSDEALATLSAHAFPGNVRELRNSVERAVIQCRGPTIGPGDLDLAPPALRPAAEVPGSEPTAAIDLDLAAAEVRLIREALRRAGGRRSRAAQLLGISREALRRRLARHGLDPPGAGGGSA